MATVAFNLHPAQVAIHQDPARFKVVAAGRRFGKTVYSVIRCFEEALAQENALGMSLDDSSEVIYVGIDREQAKRNAWPYFKKFAAEIEKATGLELRVLEKTSMIEMPPELGGCRIRLLGMDDPDAARGMKLRFAVLDEYADMPPRVWPEIIRPALADVRGGALFIGTPKGRNHFYELIAKAIAVREEDEANGNTPTWGVFNYSTDDNPLIDEEERADMIREYTNGSQDLYEQEIAAKFISQSGQLFNADQFDIVDELPKGHYDWHLAVDLAGFEPDPDRKSQLRKLDDTAIAVVAVNGKGHWYVVDIQSGKWGVRETALRIVKTAHDHSIPIIGIEKGMALNAVSEYMQDYMAQFGRWLEIRPLTHGNKRKFDRIQWALQGRAQKGEIHLVKGDWNQKLIDQAVSFPDKYVHDDLVDALAYIDQLNFNSIHIDVSDLDEIGHVPLDARAGY